MSDPGRFLPHAPQHHRMLPQGPLNGKNRPFSVSRVPFVERPLRKKSSHSVRAI